MRQRRIAILGSRGIPARYGGFETFAEELSVRLAAAGYTIDVFCETDRPAPDESYKGVRLIHVRRWRLGPLTTILFDIACLWRARKGYDVAYMLGYGAAFFCFLPRLWGTRVWINMDGVEWARSKWSYPARQWFKLMEWTAMRSVDNVVADAEGIKRHLQDRHGSRRQCTVISYGAYPVNAVPDPTSLGKWGLVSRGYFLIVCRLEPENHVLEFLRGFASSNSRRLLVVVGDNEPGRSYVSELAAVRDERIRFIGTVFDKEAITSLRFHCFAYLHGHSVGGTNPSLLEAMGCGNLVIAHDNVYNREVLGEGGFFVDKVEGITAAIAKVEDPGFDSAAMRTMARERISENYSWEKITSKYEQLFQDEMGQPKKHLAAMTARMLFCALAILASRTGAETGNGIISDWMNFKKAAVSIVFDDNSSDQFEYAVPMMDARDIQGTFFVVPNWAPTVWDSIRAASARGHEIGSHTVSHPDMAALTDSSFSAAERELKDSKDSIEARLPGKRCLTLAWPFNRCNKVSKALAGKYYITARQGEGTLEVASPFDRFAMRSMPFTDSPGPMNDYVDEAISKNRWLIELLHRVHTTPYALIHTNVDSLRLHLDYLKERRDSLWIAPYGDVFRYIQERDSSTLTLVESSDSVVVFSLVHGMDSSIYNLPLSLEITLPKGSTGLSASQGGAPIEFENKTLEKATSIRLAAYPNRGDIAIKIKRPTLQTTRNWTFQRLPGSSLKQDESRGNVIFFRWPHRGQLTVKSFDTMGKEVGDSFRFHAEPDFSYRLEFSGNRVPRSLRHVAIFNEGKVILRRSMVSE